MSAEHRSDVPQRCRGVERIRNDWGIFGGRQGVQHRNTGGRLASCPPGSPQRGYGKCCVYGVVALTTCPTTAVDSFERWRKPLLTCGILAGALYVAMTLFVGMLWDGYNATDQTISELSAIGAPTRPIWTALATIYTTLMIAFGWIVWKSARHRRLRILGALLFTQAVFGVFWPPMHQRAVLAAGGGTLTDTLHIVWTIVTSLFFMGALGFSVAGMGKRFRFYSLVTMVIVFACGAWTATYAPAIQHNLPTPWVGVWERINTNAFMLWIAVLAVALLRAPLRSGLRTAA